RLCKRPRAKRRRREGGERHHESTNFDAWAAGDGVNTPQLFHMATARWRQIALIFFQDQSFIRIFPHSSWAKLFSAWGVPTLPHLAYSLSADLGSGVLGRAACRRGT